jgi:hypothetical protein
MAIFDVRFVENMSIFLENKHFFVPLCQGLTHPGMMGSPSEMMEGIQGGGGGSSHTKATFSGMTALIGVLALIVSIISVAVPHWGSYSPIGQQYFSAGKFHNRQSALPTPLKARFYLFILLF